MHDMLARQMAASVNSAVFPGLPHHLPLYASAPSPSLPSLNPLPAAKDAAGLPGSSEDGGSSYVQHLQSEYGKSSSSHIPSESLEIVVGSLREAVCVCVRACVYKVSSVSLRVCVCGGGGGVQLILAESESFIVASCNVYKITEHGKFLFCAELLQR